MKRIGLLTVLTMLLITSLSYASPYAIVLSVKGSVDVLSSESYSWDIVEKGNELKRNDKIRTGPASNIKIKFENGTEINIDPNTTIEIISLVKEDSIINVMVGKIKAIVEKLKPKEKFSATTPATVCSVRGTLFTVEVLKNKKTIVKVFSGIVATRRIDAIGEEIMVHPNERIEYEIGLPPVKYEARGRAQSLKGAFSRAEVVQEMRLDMSREQIQAAAAKEMQVSEYQLGKTMIDAFGKRVRLDEYIIRSNPDEFKFVALNDRDDRFDYFIYEAQFNRTLPTDLADVQDSFFNVHAISTFGGDEYYIREFEKSRSNTTDAVINGMSGGHKSGTGVAFNKLELEIRGANGTLKYSEEINVNDTSKVDCLLRVGNSVYSETIALDSSRSLYSATIGTDKNSNGVSFEWLKRVFKDGTYYKEDYYTIDDEGNAVTAIVDLDYNGEMVYTSDLMSNKIDIVMDPKLFVQ